MHITYITSEFVTEKNKGGLATYLNNIARIMSCHGQEVTIITLSDTNEEFHYETGINVIRVRARNIRSKEEIVGREFDLLYNSWKLYQAVTKLHRVKKIDIIQAANYQGIGIFRHYKIPTVIRASSDNSFLRNAAMLDFKYQVALKEKTFEDYLELLSVRQADCAYAPSKCCAEILQKRSGRKLEVVESPFIKEKTEMDRSVYETKLLNKRYLLMNCSLSLLKGTHLLIQLTDYLMKKYPDLFLVYAGRDLGLLQKDGNRQSVAEVLGRQSKKYEGRVIYLGELNREKLFPVVENALACVLPSRIDNLPNSCIEAMAMRRIVIGTYGASFEQLIHNKENGLLIKRDSEVSLKHAIDYLMQLSDEQRLDMQRKAGNTVERLSPERIYEQVIQLYEKTIQKKKRRN